MSGKYEQFGKFVLLDKVAAGGMAEVYRAKAPGAEGIGKILAIKRILPQYTSNNEFIEMFKSEAKIAINLTQGNIAQIYEFGEDKSQFYLLMEYIDGRNLRQVLSRCAKMQKALTIEQCVFVISQVASGLDYAHRCIDKNTGGPLNIIHRDMSPQNIMLSFEGEVKIIDFGIAKAETKIENTRAGTLKGKFGYMSPEQAEGYELDARTDIFSTGIVLWELLSGERLFIANNEVNTIRKIKECQIPSLRKINPNIHEELERISLKALAKDRNLRYQTASELHRDLSRFLYKVNPEFTPHDLAVTVKTLFKDDILDDRKKLLEFAKVAFVNPRDDKTVATSESTKTVTEANEATATTRGESKLDVPKNLVTDSKMQVEKIDFSSVQGSELAKSFFRSQQNTQLMSGSQITLQTPVGSKSRNRANTQSGVKAHRPRRAPSSVAKWAPILLMVMGIGSVLYLFTQNRRQTKEATFRLIGKSVMEANHLIDHGKSLLGMDSALRMPAGPVQKTEQGSLLPMQRVYIDSRPAGAQVEIDGNLMGTTPLEIKLPITHSQSTIAIKREGYLTYYKQYVASDNGPAQFTATLQRAIVGYVNIDVVPSFADIYIDGQRLTENAPIEHYSIPADRPIVIRAQNPYSNTYDQRTVNVKPDTVVDVKLFLHRAN